MTLVLAFPVFIEGLALSLGLIVAIGAQNAFVLRQGLRREYIGSVVLFCSITDALLIAAGVLGMAQAIKFNPVIATALTVAGIVFLTVYGWQALRRAWTTGGLHADSQAGLLSRAAVIAQAAAFTLLNPHVYLDTVLLVGSVGAQHSADMQPIFIAGACSASALWFAGLGFGARWLAPVFAKPRAWQILDIAIAVIMWLLAAGLVMRLEI